MKVFIVLLVLVFALVDGFPGKGWEKRRPGSGKHDERPYKYFEDRVVKTRPGWDKQPWKGGDGMGRDGEHGNEHDMPHVRWCVTNPCEMKKCKRMTTEFNYMVNPRLHWSCVMASCKESCMEEIRHGHADIMTAKGDEIYTAGKIHDLIPIMSVMEDHKDIPDYDTKFKRYEEQDGSLKHYSIVLVKKTNLDVNNFQDMSQRKSCHSGVDTQATFKSPICALIHEGVIPRAGNVYESAGDFFQESCVPGVQHDKYNPNMTNPESLCKLCKGPDDDDFCETLTDKEPYYGFTGTLKCLRDGAGDVAFVHTHDVMANYETLSQEFDIVCKNNRLPLDWDNVVKRDCHLTEERPQALMVYTDKPEDWISDCTSALKDASTRFRKTDTVNAFSLFDSSPYCAKTNGDDKQGEQHDQDSDEYDRNWMKNKDLIFKDRSSSLLALREEQRTYKTFLGTDQENIWKTCQELEPKPRAFICVVGDEEMKKCQDLITKFQTITDVKKISWGCVEASSKKECMEMVAKNLADLVDLNATDMFIAGMDYNLAPFMAENYNRGKDPWTESITIGVMRKDNTDLPEDMRGWKMCNAGVHKISGFLHPMGWLLANGTIQRSSSPLKSIGHHFGESCVPGMNTVDLTKHPLFSRTLDWGSILRDKFVSWEDWYQTPLWRKWQDKQNGNNDEYEPMHDMQNFESPKFLMLIEKMSSEDPRLHAHHTPEIHEILEKTKKDFRWESYDGLEDFYAVKMPKWKMISWVWQKPEDWTEEEWRLFEMWAENRWDQKEDWGSYTDMWTDGDWDTFKKWMDTEYKAYNITAHMSMHEDTFIRLSLLCSRHHWLMDQWKNLQWDNVDIKHCRERMCEACAGQGDEKCSMDSDSEDYYGYEGALKCLEQGDGDVAFIDAYTLEDTITKNGYTKDDFILLCPDGKTVDYTGKESFKECNFGRVPSHALVTCNMHDGVWRWKVAKALLEAEKVLTPQKMYQNSIFNKEVESLTTIPFVNQTYQVWLGPMFLRAMEGFMQPPVKVKEWEDEFDAMAECEGEECDGDEEDRPACDECADEDTVCLENCWSVGPPEQETKRQPDKNKRRPHRRQKPGKTGDNELLKGGRNSQRRGGRMPHRKPKKTTRMLWKPKGRRMHQLMRKKHTGAMMMNMGPMKHQGMRPMGQPRYGVNPMRPPMMGRQSRMGPMTHGMKPMMPGMMHPEKSMGPMKFGMKPMMHGMKYGMDKMQYMMHKKMMGMTPGKPYMRPMMMRPMMKQAMMGQDTMMGHRMMPHRMETGPIIHSRKSIRGEFYTNVIFARDGTCNAIVHDLSCFGEQRNIRMRAGRVGKTHISVPMCPQPTIMKRTTALFTCDNSAGFLKPILLPVRCSYTPCNPSFWFPDRSNPHQNRVDKTKPWRRGGMKWKGQDWRKV